MNRSIKRLCLLLICTVGLFGCDSAEEAEPSEEIAAMYANLQSAMTVALAGGPGKTAGVEAVRSCPQGGTVDVTGTTTGSSINATMAFSNCNGIDGNLTLTGASTFANPNFTYNLTMNGELEERCTIDYNGFQQHIAVNTQTSAATVTLNGNFSATCAAGSVTCAFNSTQLNPNGDNQSLFQSACN